MRQVSLGVGCGAAACSRASGVGVGADDTSGLRAHAGSSAQSASVIIFGRIVSLIFAF
jgi:hypothetical protein